MVEFYQWVLLNAKDISVVALMGILAAYVLFRAANMFFSSYQSRLTLEKKFTKCREELIEWKEKYAALHQHQQHAVEDYLEDTKNFDKELGMYEREILSLTGALRDKEELLQVKDSLIARYIAKYGVLPTDGS